MSDVSVTEDQALGGLAPGGQLSHVFRVATEQDVAPMIQMLQVLAAAGGRLRGSRTAACGAGMDHRLEVSGLRLAEARDLADSLSRVAGVRFLGVEHHLAPVRAPPQA